MDIAGVIRIDRETAAKEAGADDDAVIGKWLGDKIKAVNSLMPSYKSIKYFVYTEEDFIKTTTLKIKRSEVEKKIREKLEKSGSTMRSANMKNIDKL